MKSFCFFKHLHPEICQKKPKVGRFVLEKTDFDAKKKKGDVLCFTAETDKEEEDWF